MGSKQLGIIFSVLALGFVSASGISLYSFSQTGLTHETTSTAVSGSFSLITEPEDGMAPVEQLLESASSSIDVVMYEFEDTQLEKLLADEARKGINVRVILDNGYFGGGSQPNEAAYDYLRSNGVAVHWSPDRFALTHEKSIVVDNAEALIMTFNFSPQYYKNDRDFGVLDSDHGDVAAMEQTFDADWNGRGAAENGDDLVWSPDSRPQLLSLIEAATSSLEVYNEEMEDPQIISALAQSAMRGVNVQVDMTNADNWTSAFERLSGAGVHVRTYAANASRYIHAKVVIADGGRAFVGSENFSSTSLDQNRELGIIVRDPGVVASLRKTFAGDWTGATPFAHP